MEEEVHPSYLAGHEDVEGLPYPISSLGPDGACAPIPCPGGVEIVLVGEGIPRVGAFAEETNVLSSFSRLGLIEENRQDMRGNLPMEPDDITHDIMERQEQDRLIPSLSSPKFTLPPPDIRTVHHMNPPTYTSPWGFQTPETQGEDSGVAGVSSEGQYIQDRRYEWALGLDEAEANSRLMTVRSIPPPISMPVFRRALQLGREQVAWQGGNYSEEEAQVEVEEEEEEEEEGSVYTCIECSIYFKKKAHLLEHMFQHSQENEGEGSQTRDGPHTCGECGKGFVDEGSLVSHRRQHQESRQKIIEEIRKLENLEDEGRGARLQCPKCLFGTNSSKVFVQHAKTHVRKGPGDGRGATTSFQDTLEMSESGGASEQSNDRIWNSPQTEAGSEQGWVVEIPQDTQNKGAKSKRKTPPREGSGRYLQTDSRKEVGTNASVRDPRIPQAAVELKWRFRDALKASGGEEEGKRRQLRAEVAIVVLENIAPKKQRPKGPQALSYERRICRGEDGAEHSLPSGTSALELELPQEEWGESGIPLDILLMDPNYEGQLEALGLRSEERECPYCPDRFHNGIGLANHVRGHLNRVGVSYNVRHFISAEEVKAIEQNYSFQKKRKKVANFDPSTFSLMRCEFCGAGFDTRAGLSSHARAHLRDFGITNWELTVSPIHVLARLLARSPGRPLPPFPTWHQDADTDAIGSEEEDETPLDLWHSQIPKQESGRVVEKMASDQNAGRSEDQKGPGQTTCEVCGACFETRKGLSSHARSHLRHLGVAGSESSGAPIDLLYELAKQGKLPQEESFLGAKKAGSPLPGSPRGQWGDEDGPLNLTMDAEPGRDTDCQFCGAWFETRKGLSSHARAHLRHLGVTDPDAKGSPIAALNALIKSEDFKKRLSAGHVSVEADTHIKTSENSTSTNSGMSISQHRDLSAHSKLTEAGTFSRMADGTVKAGDGASAKMTDGNMLAVHSDGSVRSFDSGMSAETAIHFKCPSTGGTNAHVKHGESSTPRALTPVISSHPKMDKGGNAHVKSETGSSHNKMLKVGSHPKASPTGLAHPRPSPTGTPSVKKLKTSKASMDSYWSSSNSSTPLNLSPGSEEVRCEFCGEFFENRKGLSSHARSHLRQMGVTEWHVNGSPIDTLREILASGTCPRPGTRVGGPSSEKLLPLSPSPSGSAAYSGLAPGLQHKPHRLHSYPAGEWPSDLSPLNLSSRADPTRDIRCEFCNEFFENRKGLSSHARSHLRQMGVTEWHVNGSPIDTLREIIRKRRPPPPHLPNIKKEPRGDRNPTSPSPSPTHSPLSMGPPGLAREIPISPLGGRPHNFMSPLSPKRPASHEPRMSHSEPKNYIHLEPKSCNQSQAKSYMQGDSRPKSFMQEEGRSKSYMQGDGRPKPYMQGDGRPKPYAQGEGKPKGYLQGEGKPKGYLQGEGKPKGYLQGEGKPKGYLQGEGKPKGYLQGEGKPKGYLQGEGKPKGYLQGEGKPKGYLQGEGKPKGYLQGEGKPKGYLQGEGKPRGYLQGEGKPRGYLQGEGKPRGYLQGEGKPRGYLQGEGKPRSYLQGEGKPRSYLQGEGKPKGYLQGEGKPKGYPQGEGKLKGYPQGDGKPKAYIQTELPFKVKVKASPDKAATTLEACCELCGLYFENRKALASHARAHLRQFGVTEWCVNGSPIETLREWMKQRPQKAGAYLSYIQGGRPFTKKFKRSSQPPKAAVSTEKESQVPVPNKVAEMDWTSGTPGTLTEKPTEGQGQKTERRYSKPTEFPPTREDGIAEPTPKSEEQRPPIRARPVPSLVPRPPQTSLVKFVGNIYTLKCRFCDIQFQGPLSIQEQWVRHLQHHILEMNFSKSPSPPPVLPPPAHPEPAKAV